MRGLSRRAVRRLVLMAATTVIAVAGLGAIAAPSMARDFRLPTTTTLVASPSAVAPSGSTTLTASVRPGLLVGPIGNVRFTDSTTGAVLGTVKPKLACLLKREPCVATITVPASALAPGDNAIVAAYSGGLFTKPSSGSANVFVGAQNTCQAGSGQCTTTTSSPDGTSSATISSTAPGAGAETVQAFFDSEAAPCATVEGGTVGAGDTLVYSVTNPGGESKTVTLTLIGAAADAEHQLDPDSFGNVCFFGAPSSFVTNTGDPAMQAPDGTFFGNLPLCDDEDGDNDNTNDESGGNFVVPAGAFPCINFVDAGRDTWAKYTPGSGSTPSTYVESFTTTASDPKAHG
jgi:Big-like domain-containing protein